MSSLTDGCDRNKALLIRNFNDKLEEIEKVSWNFDAIMKNISENYGNIDSNKEIKSYNKFDRMIE